MEREAKLAITGERPGAVADEIAALTELAACPLVLTGTVALRDVYLDTPSGALRARGGSLRVRIADGQAFVTLKGGGREVEPGVIEREELELPWSEEAYARLLDALVARGVTLRPRGGASDDAVGTLLMSGLVRIQARDTSRRVREARDASGHFIAELAVDEVTFRLHRGPVRHHEVEIEAKAPAGGPYLPRAVEALGTRFGSALTSWPYGKLATGFAIERLLSGDPGALRPDGHLSAAAYPRLAEMLSREPALPGDG